MNWRRFYEEYSQTGCPRALCEYKEVEHDFIRLAKRERFGIYDYGTACHLKDVWQYADKDLWKMFTDTAFLMAEGHMPGPVCVARMATLLDELRTRFGGEAVF